MITLFLCIKIFFVRIIDVSLGTIRTIMTVKDKRFIATFIGFFEVLIWFLIVREALDKNDSQILIALFFALGYATGTYIGTYLSSRFIKGNFTVQVITSSRRDDVVKIIKESGYGVFVIDVKSSDKKIDKYMIFIEINKHNFNHLKDIIKKLDNKAFIVVNETRFVQNGYLNK